jgi:hypothetical protein
MDPFYKELKNTHGYGRGWVDFELAPTTPGTKSIVCAKNEGSLTKEVGEAFIGRDGLWYWAGAEAGYHDPISEANGPITHWMPLPEAP